MKHHQVNGKNAIKIFKFILPTKNKGTSFIDIPNSWIQALTFIPNTQRLSQNESGPCGLFAVLQAYIIAAIKFNPKYTPQQALQSAVLEIMLKLRQSFVFCTDFGLETGENMESSHCYIELEMTDNKQEAEYFLESNNYFSIENVTILLMISFAFLSGPKLLSSFAIPETFITHDGMTDVHFVYLILTGKAIDVPCDECKNLGGILFSGVKEKQQIGFLSVSEEISEPIGDNFLYPDYETWVLHYGGHFTAVTRQENKFYEYDAYNHSEDNVKVLNKLHVMWSKLTKIANYIDRH
ncbi:hypothetical protein M9Y10_040887 [Tritrichomonas musculus]|uniref:Deubiquitinating enzyme MINDY-3/4 conserved domain-containing protein n=1 Tax=Tritrichomonas musculus TaxID=1915356 RepID=A0ABR2K2Y6_9EUKA